MTIATTMRSAIRSASAPAAIARTWPVERAPVSDSDTCSDTAGILTGSGGSGGSGGSDGSDGKSDVRGGVGGVDGGGAGGGEGSGGGGWKRRGDTFGAHLITQMQSDAIRCDQMQSKATRCDQMRSEATRGNQRYS